MENRPEVEFGNELYLLAFYDLNSCRPAGFGVSQIPWLATHEWCKENEVFGDQRQALLEVIKQVDLAYMLILREKSPKPDPGPKVINS